MLKHGINTYKDDTGIVSVQTAAVGIPFFIGTAPVHLGKGFVGKPQMASDFSEAEELLGFSYKWRDDKGKPYWNLCQAMYAHFKLCGMSPAVFYNIFDPAKHKKSVPANIFTVTDKLVTLPEGTILNDNLIVKDGEDVLIDGTDFTAFYIDTNLCVELTEDSTHTNAAELNIAYDIADPSAITVQDVEIAVEAVEMCRSVVGVVPDLICAPGWSSNPTVAAVMAAKAPSINGLFKAKAVVDLDSSAAADYADVLKYKTDNGYVSEDMIVCWPLVRNGDYIFDLSTVVCGLIAKVDSGNGDCPYESPSNKSLAITGALNAKGEEINLSLPQADVISVTDGVVTAINNGGWTLWGNYTGCFPKSSDVAKTFICTNRVQDWICNTFVNTFWQYIDRPFTPVFIDAIINAFNTWLNGLTAEGKLYGGAISYDRSVNPVSNLLDGIIRLDCQAASPVPAQRIDMHVQYDVEQLQAAINS